jgi:hypothetical protein
VWSRWITARELPRRKRRRWGDAKNAPDVCCTNKHGVSFPLLSLSERDREKTRVSRGRSMGQPREGQRVTGDQTQDV